MIDVIYSQKAVSMIHHIEVPFAITVGGRFRAYHDIFCMLSDKSHPDLVLWFPLLIIAFKWDCRNNVCTRILLPLEFQQYLSAPHIHAKSAAYVVNMDSLFTKPDQFSSNLLLQGHAPLIVLVVSELKPRRPGAGDCTGSHVAPPLRLVV